MAVALLLALLISAPAEPAAPVHLGMGWTAAQAVAAAEVEEHEQSTQVAQAKTPAVLPRGGLHPPSTFDAIRQTRRARAIAIGSALAVQGAMIVYGIMSMMEQRREAAAQRAEFPTFNPYPR